MRTSCRASTVLWSSHLSSSSSLKNHHRGTVGALPSPSLHPGLHTFPSPARPPSLCPGLLRKSPLPPSRAPPSAPIPPPITPLPPRLSRGDAAPLPPAPHPSHPTHRSPPSPRRSTLLLHGLLAATSLLCPPYPHPTHRSPPSPCHSPPRAVARGFLLDSRFGAPTQRVPPPSVPSSSELSLPPARHQSPTPLHNLLVATPLLCRPNPSPDPPEPSLPSPIIPPPRALPVVALPALATPDHAPDAKVLGARPPSFDSSPRLS